MVSDGSQLSLGCFTSQDNNMIFPRNSDRKYEPLVSKGLCMIFFWLIILVLGHGFSLAQAIAGKSHLSKKCRDWYYKITQGSVLLSFFKD